LGSNTYEQTLELGWPYGDKPLKVLTNRSMNVDHKSIEFWRGDLVDLFNNRLKAKYKSIWIVGGADLVKKFIQMKLADEIIISIISVILGVGKLVFNYIGLEPPLHLKNVTAYKDGIVELNYEFK
jgi:dihydrofolate reductase